MHFYEVTHTGFATSATATTSKQGGGFWRIRLILGITSLGPWGTGQGQWCCFFGCCGSFWNWKTCNFRFTKEGFKKTRLGNLVLSIHKFKILFWIKTVFRVPKKLFGDILDFYKYQSKYNKFVRGKWQLLYTEVTLWPPRPPCAIRTSLQEINCDHGASFCRSISTDGEGDESVPRNVTTQRIAFVSEELKWDKPGGPKVATHSCKICCI